MKEATLNIRLDATLKQHGAEVLNKEGLTVTEAVRALYEYMEEHQTLPEGLLAARNSRQSKAKSRRKLMRSLVGILPADVTLAEAKEARLARHGL